MDYDGLRLKCVEISKCFKFQRYEYIISNVETKHLNNPKKKREEDNIAYLRFYFKEFLSRTSCPCMILFLWDYV